MPLIIQYLGFQVASFILQFEFDSLLQIFQEMRNLIFPLMFETERGMEPPLDLKDLESERCRQQN